MTAAVLTPDVALDRAADLIEQRGLAHGHFQTPDGALCSLGALRVAIWGEVADIPNGDPYWPIYITAGEWLAEIIRPESIVFWNDSHQQRKVVAGLRRAARLAREARP